MKALNDSKHFGIMTCTTPFEPREMASASRKSHQNNQQDDGSSEVSRSWATKQSTFFPHFFQVLLKLISMLLRSHLRDWLLPNHLVPLSEVGRESVLLSYLSTSNYKCRCHPTGLPKFFGFHFTWKWPGSTRRSPCRAWKNSTLALSQIAPMSVLFRQLQTELSVTDYWLDFGLLQPVTGPNRSV